MTPMILASPPVPEASVVGATATSGAATTSNDAEASNGADFAGLIEALMAGAVPGAGVAEAQVGEAAPFDNEAGTEEETQLADGNSLPTDGMPLPAGLTLPPAGPTANHPGGKGTADPAQGAVDTRLVQVGSAKPLTTSQSPVVEFALQEDKQGADPEGESKPSLVDWLSRHGGGDKEKSAKIDLPASALSAQSAVGKDGGEGRSVAGFSAIEALVRGAQAETGGTRIENNAALLTPAVAPTASNSPTATATPAPTTVTMATSPREPNWGDAFGRNLAELAIKGAREVSFHVDPPELGPIDVSLRLDQQRVDIHLSANHALTREVLQQSLPQLRELFAAGGLQLGGANIEARDQGQQNPSQQGQAGNGRQGEALAKLPAELDQQVASLNSQYLLDFYA